MTTNSDTPQTLATGHTVTFPMRYLPTLWQCTCGATGGGGIEGATQHTRPTCPDCHSPEITPAPAQSRMTWLCEHCGRTFVAD
ncbi:MAG: hypothetical protein KF861_21540 [Planctomycetaceae bacterium]|nr:hypothetical protein [Planctomycetaceae bacterium]